ncbi:MAG: Na/Pi symporter [Chitinophagales bacterium]
MTQNRVLGVLVGFVITALLQSSSATTVMTVSFVNAGLLTLVESAGVMMGANIGTTITGWLVNIVGKFKIATIALPIIGNRFPSHKLFSNKGNWKFWGQFLIGFALLLWV